MHEKQRFYHACLFYIMQIIFTRYFKTASAAEPGTLSFLRNLINRRNITGQVSKEMNAADDFLQSVLFAYATAAMATFFGMNSTTDEPSIHRWNAPLVLVETAKWTYLNKQLTKLVSTHVMPRLTFTLKVKEENSSPDSNSSVQNYVWGLLTDLLVAEEFRDAIREGDGDRVFRLWKLFQLYFRASGHTKYAFESVQLVADVKSLQSEQTAHRILWSRFVNTKGGLGHNISCDLHMEHLNCAFKTHLGTAGGNVTEKTLLRTGKALSTLQAVSDAFDGTCSIGIRSSAHSHKSANDDEDIMIKALLEHKVYSSSGEHATFRTFPYNFFGRIDRVKYSKWMQGHIKRLGRSQIQRLVLRQHDRFGSYLEQFPATCTWIDHPLSIDDSAYDSSTD